MEFFLTSTHRKMAATNNKLYYCTVCPFDQYLQHKNDWVSKHPNGIIIEEIKNLSIGMIEIPDPQLIGKTKQAQALLIAWAIIYIEK